MPKEITHVAFADLTSEQIKNTEIYKHIFNSKNSFHFGSLAVDSFYYNMKLPIIDKDFFQWGDLVHGAEGNNPFIAIYAALKYLKENKNDSLFSEKLAFICGYLTHCAMDINFHPYVYYFSGNYYDPDKNESINAQMRHRIIESWIDLYIIKNKGKYNTKSAAKVFNTDNLNIELLKFISTHFAATWQTNEQKVFIAIKRGYFVQKILNNIFDNKNIKDYVKSLNQITKNKIRSYLALFYPDNFDIPDYIINFGTYKNPVTGEEFNSSFEDLWSNALNLSTDFLNAVDQYLFDDNDLILQETIKGYSLDVGLIEVPVKEVKYFSTWNISP